MNPLNNLELVNASLEKRVLKQHSINPEIVKSLTFKAITMFRWDEAWATEAIEISACGRTIFLKEDTYLFRSIVADRCFTAGLHYWEIVPDARTENEMKVGVTKSKEFDRKTSFSDYSHGWAYYGVG